MNQRQKPRTVLIVDDNELIRMTLRTVLRNAGLEVIGEAADGEKALAQLELMRINLVCLDVVMPRMNGLEVLAEIRARHPDVKVLMVTGQADRETIQAAISGGAHGIIVKPFREKQIHDTLTRVLG